MCQVVPTVNTDSISWFPCDWSVGWVPRCSLSRVSLTSSHGQLIVEPFRENPVRSSSPATNPAPTGSPLSHVPKPHTRPVILWLCIYMGLNTSKDSNSATSLGSLSQYLTILSVKKLFPISNLNHPCYCLGWFPLALSLKEETIPHPSSFQVVSQQLGCLVGRTFRIF